MPAKENVSSGYVVVEGSSQDFSHGYTDYMQDPPERGGERERNDNHDEETAARLAQEVLICRIELRRFLVGAQLLRLLCLLVKLALVGLGRRRYRIYGEECAMSDFVKVVAAGPTFFVSAWVLMIFAGIVHKDVGILPFGYVSSMVVTIGLWLTVAPVVGAIARISRPYRNGR